MIAVLACELTQREALLEIYNSNGGGQWANSAPWDIMNPVCSWEGIMCNQDFVQYINFKNFGLTGVLVDVFGCFPHLKGVNLENNKLESAVPHSLCLATHM